MIIDKPIKRTQADILRLANEAIASSNFLSSKDPRWHTLAVALAKWVIDTEVVKEKPLQAVTFHGIH